MKSRKISTILFITMFSVSLVGCSNNKIDNQQTQEVTTQEELEELNVEEIVLKPLNLEGPKLSNYDTFNKAMKDKGYELKLLEEDDDTKYYGGELYYEGDSALWVSVDKESNNIIYTSITADYSSQHEKFHKCSSNILEFYLNDKASEVENTIMNSFKNKGMEVVRLEVNNNLSIECEKNDQYISFKFVK